MDLGIAGRRALVCASSRGLGFACAHSLAREGAIVTINGRDAARLAEAKSRLETIAAQPIRAVVADLNDPAGRALLLDECGDVDILVNNNGGPSPGRFEDWDETAWLDAIQANMLPALMLIRALLPGQRARRFGRIVNVTSAMVKSPRAPMGLSTAARTALTAACKALVPVVAPDNVTINSLLPERFDTERQQQMARRAMAARGIGYEQARAEIEASIAVKRMGRPEELGDACAYLCSAQAGFISGQMLQMDGGSYAALV